MVWLYIKQFLKTVIPVKRLDREDDEISTTLGRSANEKTYAKELNRLALQQKDTEIGTFFSTLETLFCTKKAARRLAESHRFTAKLWNKGLATMRLIRSNETPKKSYKLYVL